MAKKMTIEEFETRANSIHKNKYKYFQDFVSTRKEVVIECPEHGIFRQTPKNHLNGQGCPICGKELAKNCHKNNYEHFLQQSKDKFDDIYEFPNIEEEYVNGRSKITIVCKHCGSTFIKIARDHLSSPQGGCICYRKKMISYEDLCEQAKISDNDTIIPFLGVKSIRDGLVDVKCKLHGVRKHKIISLLQGKCHCKICYGLEHSARRLPEDEVKERLEILTKGSHIHPLMCTYRDTMTPMIFGCKDCGTLFPRTLNALMATHNNTCPKCNKEKISQLQCKTTEEFITEAKNKYGDKFDYSETVYTKSSEPVTIKCTECGRHFTMEANSFLQRGKCPYHNCNSSNDEKEINEFINSLGYETITNDRKTLDGKEIDILLPNNHMAIEYDGLFWHSEMRKNDDYNLSKTLLAETKNMRMIHIFEDEWKHKKEICKSRISNILGTTPNRIFARKCEIREVNSTTAKDFLIQNHIQGYCHSQIRLGLYYNNELVSLMTFGKTRHFIGNSRHQYELLRFCNKLNTSIVGGASKLFKHFIKTYDPINIVSYADRRWSTGNLYYTLGFQLYNISKPNYFYVIGYERKNRFNFRKSILVSKYNCPQEKSEREFCKEQGWYRIYDCGCLCFEWSKKQK